jgi:acyl-CoA synthetase (AMP-forming)/AMP-acid ligase II
MSWAIRPIPRAAAFISSGAWQGRTLADDARHWAERAPDAEIFVGEPTPATYASILGAAMALGRGLRRLDVTPGDTISFMIPNWPEAAVINLAAAAMGFVVNPIVPIYRDAETRFILHDCRSRVIFIPVEFRRFDYPAMLARLRADLPELRYVIAVRGVADGAIGYEEVIALGAGPEGATPRVDPSGVKLVMYTSGTTGTPKAVLHNHQTLARAVQVSSTLWRLGSATAVLMPSPVTHVSGYSGGLERPFLQGGRTVLMQEWNADQAVALIDRHGVAMTVAATPFLQELVDAAERAGSRLPSLRVFACGGAAVSPELIRRANTAFAQPCACRVYGSSEAPFISLGDPADPDPLIASDTDGRVLDYDVRLLAADGADAEEGEIAARGPALFLGYGDAAQTEASFTPDGYFLTGDIGRFTPAGGLVITGRKKDLIIRGGENISAKEIEDALHLHPHIVEAAVVAAPHKRLGEGVFAFVILRPGSALTLAEIGAFLAHAGLARQKAPEGMRAVQDFPRTASGKIRKDLLRQAAAESG